MKVADSNLMCAGRALLDFLSGGSITKYRDLHPRLLNPAGEISFRLTILLITDTNSRHHCRDQNQPRSGNLIAKVLKRIRLDPAWKMTQKCAQWVQES